MFTRIPTAGDTLRPPPRALSAARRRDARPPRTARRARPLPRPLPRPFPPTGASDLRVRRVRRVGTASPVDPRPTPRGPHHRSPPLALLLRPRLHLPRPRQRPQARGLDRLRHLPRRLARREPRLRGHRRARLAPRRRPPPRPGRRRRARRRHARPHVRPPRRGLRPRSRVDGRAVRRRHRPVREPQMARLPQQHGRLRRCTRRVGRRGRPRATPLPEERRATRRRTRVDPTRAPTHPPTQNFQTGRHIRSRAKYTGRRRRESRRARERRRRRRVPEPTRQTLSRIHHSMPRGRYRRHDLRQRGRGKRKRNGHREGV